LRVNFVAALVVANGRNGTPGIAAVRAAVSRAMATEDHAHGRARITFRPPILHVIALPHLIGRRAILTE
jgi:hypothetical protein